MSETATATPVAPGADVIGSLGGEQLAHWRLTGELPSARSSDPASDTTGATPSTPPADSSPAAPDVQAAATAASQSPASEPGTPKKANAETRKAELQSEVEALKALLKERHELRQQLAAHESQASVRPAARDVQSAASSPATQLQTLDAILSAPDPTAPLLTDGEFYERYPDATLTDFTRYVARHEVAYERAQAERTAVIRARGEAFKKTLDAAMAADATFWPTVEATARELVPLDHLPVGLTPRPLHYAAQEILESPHGPALLAHLAAHPADMDALRRAPDARSAIKTITRLEAQLATPPAPVSTPVAKTTTSAPEPATALGSRPSATVDESRAAVAAGDFGRYRSVMNRREAAAS